MFGISNAIKEALCRGGFQYKDKNSRYCFKKLVMNTQLSNSRFYPGAMETISVAITHTRSKIISAADVWNIQRHKRNCVQRRGIL